MDELKVESNKGSVSCGETESTEDCGVASREELLTVQTVMHDSEKKDRLNELLGYLELRI